MVLKGAFLHHFASNKDATKRLRGRKGMIKDPGMEEVGQTISDKARKRIAIVAKLKYRAKISLPVYFFIFYFGRRAFASSQMNLFTHLTRCAPFLRLAINAKVGRTKTTSSLTSFAGNSELRNCP